MSETSTWLLSRFAPSNRSGSISDMNKWKSSSLPLCGVAVKSKKCRVIFPSNFPSWKRFVYLISLPQTVADILCASSQTIKSQSTPRNLPCKSLLRANLSILTMQRFMSKKSFSFAKILKFKWNFCLNSSCHCSARAPGQTIKQRRTSSRTINSLINKPVIIVLPAPGSSARTKRKGCMLSIFSYTPEIWCGKGSISEE